MAVLPSLLQFLTSIPLVTRLWTVSTVFGSLLYLWLRWPWSEHQPSPTSYLTLVPGIGVFFPWTFVTSALVETSVIEFFATMILVTPSLRYLEKLWGALETFKFIIVSIAFSNLIAVAMNWLEFLVTKNADLFLYGMEYHGQMALQTAILVAFTQLIPEHQVQIMGVIKARVKRLPMAYLTLSCVMTLFGFQCPWIIIQFGFFVSWVYLRFYKRSPGDMIGGGDMYGDRSETFALIHWFPPQVHYPVSLLANFVHGWATHLHLIPSPGFDIESSGNYAQTPGSARAEAERRRAMALKALDQRLAANATSSSSTPTHPPPSRPPAAPSTSMNDGSQPVVSRANERKKIPGDVDIGESGSANSDSR